jgi:hypothetical protein
MLKIRAQQNRSTIKSTINTLSVLNNSVRKRYFLLLLAAAAAAAAAATNFSPRVPAA